MTTTRESGAAPSTAAPPGRIDQIVHVLAAHDAIGTHILHLRSGLRAAGFASDLYAGEAQPEVRDLAKPMEQLPLDDRRDTWLLFHHSTGTAVAESVLRRSEPLLIDYHNVTPSTLVERWAPWLRAELDLGVEQLHEIAPRAVWGVAHSTFSQEELIGAGCRSTAVLPLLFDLPGTGSAPDPAVGRLLDRQGGGATWQFVGRVSPHKAQHDVIKAFACYRQVFDPDARLVLVGSNLGQDYVRSLERFIVRLDLSDAVRLTGPVSAPALAAYYDAADVFVCLSDHEGFCIPLVESMGVGVPVVAFDAGAVAETVGSGGVVLTDKSPLAVATTVHRVVSSPDVHGRLGAAGRRRARAFALGRTRRMWQSALADLVGGAGQRGAA